MQKKYIAFPFVAACALILGCSDDSPESPLTSPYGDLQDPNNPYVDPSNPGVDPSDPYNPGIGGDLSSGALPFGSSSSFAGQTNPIMSSSGMILPYSSGNIQPTSSAVNANSSSALRGGRRFIPHAGFPADYLGDADYQEHRGAL